MAVAPDGRRLLTADAEQSLTLWKHGDCVAIRYKMTRSNPMDTRDTELIQDACLKRETTGL